MNEANTNNNNVDGASIQSKGQHTKRQEILQRFTPKFVEKHKNSFLFFCSIEALLAGNTPYTIIQELIEIVADNNR